MKKNTILLLLCFMFSMSTQAQNIDKKTLSDIFLYRDKMEDYKSLIGKTIYFPSPTENENIYYTSFYKISPDTLWIPLSKSDSKKKQVKRYTLLNIYKGQTYTEKPYFEAAREVLRTPIEEINGKKFKIQNLSYRPYSEDKRGFISFILENVISKEQLKWNAVHEEISLEPSDKLLKKAVIIEQFDSIVPLFINKKYYLKWDSEEYNWVTKKREKLSKHGEFNCSYEMIDGYYYFILTADNIEVHKPIKELLNNFITMQQLLELRKDMGDYSVSLIKVEKPTNPLIKYGKMSTITDEKNPLFKYMYSDNIFNIAWVYSVAEKGFLFKLENKSQSTIKVIWDEASYIGVDGVAIK